MSESWFWAFLWLIGNGAAATFMVGLRETQTGPQMAFATRLILLASELGKQILPVHYPEVSRGRTAAVASRQHQELS